MHPLICGRPSLARTIVAQLAVVLLLFGCSKTGPSSKLQSPAFDSAPAEVKTLWTEGMSAWKGHHYAEAATNFISLQGKEATLAEPQTQALATAVDELGREAATAANNGDASAVQAVLALRTLTERGSRGAR